MLLPTHFLYGYHVCYMDEVYKILSPVSLMEWILHKHFIKTLIALVLDYYFHEELLETVRTEFQGFGVN